MYNINQIAMMTGLSTRTIRTHVKLGFLDGEKIDGVWMFSDEALDRYFSHSAVKPSLVAKRHALVYDFLADRKKRTNQICTVMDLSVSADEAREVSDFFCRAVSSYPDGSGLRFSFESAADYCRVILTGPEDCVRDILEDYYRS